tara:strand:- start:28 stop:204 length:177 start_codon:yes stop_codon:yes gene_type:complete
LREVVVEGGEVFTASMKEEVREVTASVIEELSVGSDILVGVCVLTARCDLETESISLI